MLIFTPIPRSHPHSGKIYHVDFNPAESEDVGQRLIQRADDTAEKLKERLANYHAQIDAVSGSFGQTLVKIDGNTAKPEVFAAIQAALVGEGGEEATDGATGEEGDAAAAAEEEGKDGEEGQTDEEDTFAMDDMLGDMAMIVDEVEEEDGMEAGEEDAAGAEDEKDLTYANVFAITVFCVDEAFETRIKDFLPSAFKLFPERKYCLVSTA